MKPAGIPATCILSAALFGAAQLNEPGFHREAFLEPGGWRIELLVLQANRMPKARQSERHGDDALRSLETTKKCSAGERITSAEPNWQNRYPQLLTTPPGRLFTFCSLADPSEKSKQTFRSRDPSNSLFFLAFLERAKRFELSTPTLARLKSRIDHMPPPSM